jgi:hypothetical protein
MNTRGKEEPVIRLDPAGETAAARETKFLEITGAPIDAGWKKQAGEALTVWLLTYVTGAAILISINAEHAFVLALLPTLSTIFYNLGIIKWMLTRAGSKILDIARLR